MTAPTERSIAENLEIIREWERQSSQPQQRSIMSHVRSTIFISFPVLFVGFLGYMITQGAQHASSEYCSCPDGGIRSTISKQRLAA